MAHAKDLALIKASTPALDTVMTEVTRFVRRSGVEAISILRVVGGRVAWSPNGDLIALLPADRYGR